MVELLMLEATLNSLIAPHKYNIHALIYNLIILTQGFNVSDDRVSITLEES